MAIIPVANIFYLLCYAWNEFAPRQIELWSLSNAFTSAFKELDPIPRYKATGKLAGFLEAQTE